MNVLGPRMITMGWTQADVDAVQRRQGRATVKQKAKYRNTKVTVAGELFDSRREADYWLELRAREHLAQIENLKRQVRWPLHAPVHGCPGVTVQVCEYVSDFEWDEKSNGDHVVCDVKGFKTPAYRQKAKHMACEYGIVILEIR